MRFSGHSSLAAVFFLLFLLSTGIAIKLYLNSQPPAILYAASNSADSEPNESIGDGARSRSTWEEQHLIENLDCKALIQTCPCLQGSLPVPTPDHQASSQAQTMLIDINNASAEELTRLPGIGPAYAERIIGLRRERGGFVYKEELLEVPGIGPARYGQLQDLVWVGPYTPDSSVAREQ